MDANEFANFLARELLMEQFASFEGIGVHSGVPTRTTPTLTPTTLKNIEQTFIEATTDAPVNLPYQAGFVPPPYPMEEHSQDRDASQESLSSNSNVSWHVSGSHGYTGDDLDSKSSASMEHSPTLPSTGGSRGRRSAFAAGLSKAGGGSNSNSSSALGGSGTAGGAVAGGSGGTGRRNVGGRRPHKPSNLTPEEEEKRRIRRERNKQAAARCRRRREDHTNELVDETDQLEKRRQSLHQEIQALQQEKDDLEFLLESHREHCRLRARLSPMELKIKTEPEEDLPVHQQPNLQPQQQQQQQQHELQEQIVAAALPNEHHPISRGPIAKKLKLSNEHTDSLDTPTPTTLFAPAISGAGKAAGPGTTRTTGTDRPSRPDSLDVKAAQFPMLSIRNELAAAVGISTPSNGLFNFDSLMEGGTGLTPIAAPITFPPNRNPLELITPTSTEPSKLCSL
ncbi:transcription factor kayak isoform X2 [Anopheles ziemanni]|uniref:transcription factor kayak isoform X2 n=1 Tax=Anopheles coustani TaxID=139045 RepID=UPI0026591AE3|nr:transcription factor kayak isoform X2 [Anopheles coustani]XP_058127910.1 transcription factor kayak isoform X2 [Anopheles coustani]XP_058127911.1 transcription factor kayak isoform X2 [Anopheles coustani]XP_058127912.1 transcription factor kayak isoform X2 [Anopheles coustani]XP_058127913.1 transcription factor kayak isoform X2 [Anopheles coustani]XP_058127914.1 transcription factor kayak isoform X2 [Anopheles coustani]XP_058127915.1 transcription factor kayak isoform X2 [Anopheles coustan